ncbi:CHASE domain-containing protein [Oxalobacteraceae bacterium A2-2]
MVLGRLRSILLRPAVLAALVLAGGLGASAAVWETVLRDAEQDAEADFQFRVRELVNSLDARMQAYIHTLYAVRGLFASSEDVDRSEFRTYLEGLELHQRMPGLQGVGYVRHVAGAGLAAYEAAVRREGYPDFHVAPGGARPEYAPITYLEPFSGANLLAFGYDTLADPVRRAAVERARDSGSPAMTGMLRLRQDGSAGAGPAGVLVLLPDYLPGLPLATLAQRRAAIRGWVYAPLRVGDVVAGLGGGRAAGLDVEIYDGETVAPHTLMYDGALEGAHVRTSLQQISIGGRRWTLRVAALPGLALDGSGRPLRAALAGVALSVLLSALTWLLARSRVRARAALARSRRLADALQQGQRATTAAAAAAQRSEALLASILDATEEGILVELPQGVVLKANRRFRQLWRVAPPLDWRDGAALARHMAQLCLPDAATPAADWPGAAADSAGRATGQDAWPAQAGTAGGGAQHPAPPAPATAGPAAPGVATPAQAAPGQAAPGPAAPGAAASDGYTGTVAVRSLLRLRDGRVLEQHERPLRLGTQLARLRAFRDISALSHSEQRERQRRQVLELLATGAPLAAVLEAVVRGVEAGQHGSMCSILLRDGERLRVAAAPSLPDFYSEALEGAVLGVGHGSCAEAALTGRRVIVEDIASDPRWQPYLALTSRAGLASCWSEPILGAGGQVLGTFAIYHRHALRPQADDLALIGDAAHLAGIAVEQAQAALDLRAGEARFRSLVDLAPVALWQQDWSAVRFALAELEREPAELARYLEANPSQLRRLADLVRITDANAAALRQAGAEGGKEQVLPRLGLGQIFDSGAMPAFAAVLEALAAGRRHVSGEASYARLDGQVRYHELTLLVMPGHEDSLDFIIVTTVDVTEQRRLQQELRELATTDFLTGLPNRRDFMRRLEEQQRRLRREPHSQAAVLLLDLDHFKRINDEYGHAGGDAVLRHVAGVLGETLRQVDSPGRLGGEEFGVLLPGADLAAAAVFAERLRQRIAAAALRLDGREVLVTASIGIAAMDAADGGGDLALNRADQALYRAKHGGRNRVEGGP